MIRYAAVILCCLMSTLPLLTAGCATAGPSALSATVQRFENTNRGTVLDAARLALRETGYRIEPRASTEDVLHTYPVDLAAYGQGGVVGEVLGRRRARRTVATTHVKQTKQTVMAYCRVEIQERSTEARRLYAHEHGLSDLPTDTPIDREGATTQEQNTVWRTIGRDKSKERSILDIIAMIVLEANSS